VVNELITGVNIALERAAVGGCPSFDPDGDDAVAIVELVAGVNHALHGCPTTPSPTATPTATPTASGTPTRRAVWAQRFGAGFASFDSVATDGDGNIIAGGSSEQIGAEFTIGSIVLPQPGMILAKFDSNGMPIWAKAFGGGTRGFSRLLVAVRPSGNIVVAARSGGIVDFGDGMTTGSGLSDILLAELGPDGNALWSTRFGDANYQSVDAVALDPDGNIVVGGSFIRTLGFGSSTLTNDRGYPTGFIAKFDRNANHLWSTAVIGEGECTVRSVAVDSTNGVVYAGDCDGDFTIEDSEFAGAGGFDVFVGRREAAGAHAWAHRFGDERDQYGNAVAIGPSDRIFVTGDVIGSIDFGGDVLQANRNSRQPYLAAFDPSGGHVWSKIFGTSADSLQRGLALAVNDAGQVALTGQVNGSIDFGLGELIAVGHPPDYNPYVATFDGDGRAVSGSLFAGNATPLGIVFDSSGIVLAGGFSGTVEFPGSPALASVYIDMFLARLPR
jgi:hypothetical protein